MSAYTTFAQPGQVSIEILKSRFIAEGQEVTTISEAEHFLKRIQAQFPDANHHCYAFKVLGPPPGDRFSDDGEPNGTAGRPIYTVLEHNLVNAIIVVTRYFGGTKLGKGGLVKAYTQAAQALLLQTGTVQREATRTLRLNYPYALSGSLAYLMQQLNVTPTLTYSDCIRASLDLPESLWASFQVELENYALQGLSWEQVDQV